MQDWTKVAEMKTASREVRLAWRRFKRGAFNYMVGLVVRRPVTGPMLDEVFRQEWSELVCSLRVWARAAAGVHFHPIVIAEIWWSSRYTRENGDWVVG